MQEGTCTQVVSGLLPVGEHSLLSRQPPQGGGMGGSGSVSRAKGTDVRSPKQGHLGACVGWAQASFCSSSSRHRQAAYLTPAVRA